MKSFGGKSRSKETTTRHSSRQEGNIKTDPKDTMGCSEAFKNIPLIHPGLPLASYFCTSTHQI
jgi:hypothetical protein